MTAKESRCEKSDGTHVHHTAGSGPSGMGFAFMEAFMDQVEVESKVGVGTIVRMKKKIGQTQQPFA